MFSRVDEAGDKVLNEAGDLVLTVADWLLAFVAGVDGAMRPIIMDCKSTSGYVCVALKNVGDQFGGEIRVSIGRKGHVEIRFAASFGTAWDTCNDIDVIGGHDGGMVESLLGAHGRIWREEIGR